MNELGDKDFESICFEILVRGGLTKQEIERLKKTYLYEPSEVVLMGIGTSKALIHAKTTRQAIYKCCLKCVQDGKPLTPTNVSKYRGWGSFTFSYKGVKNFFTVRPDLVAKAEREAKNKK